MTQVTLTATFTTAGAFTWTAPAGVSAVTVACTGGGGGAGSAGPASGSNGGGGGGGEAALEPSVAVTPGLPYMGTVGAGGAAAGNGGDTFFTGDAAVQVYAHGGQGGGNAGAAGNGPHGPGGTGSTNTVTADGGDGDDGTAATNGGGGGGAGGVSLTLGFPGNDGSGSTAGAASGGTFAGGAGGAGSTSGSGPGTAGSAPGGGGGGALSTGTGRNGGAGASGQVVITWTQSDPVTLTTNTTGGAYTFTAPQGATSVTAQAWGAGGGGFNATNNSNSASLIVGQAGATVWQVYGSTPSTNRPSIARIFDGYVGVPMALQAQKVFYTESPSGDSIANFTDANTPQQVLNLVNAGAFVVVCHKANRAYASGHDELSILTSALSTIKSAVGAANFAVVPWMECNLNDTSGNPFFASPAAYLAYWNHYISAVPSDVKVYYDPGMAQEAKAISFGQALLNGATRLPDMIGIDYYASTWQNGDFLTYPSNNAKFPGIWDLADTAGVPACVFEYGPSASATFTPTPAQWDSYINGANGILTAAQARVNAGKKVGHIIYYGGSGPGNNDIESASDFKIPDMVAIYNFMNAAAGGLSGGAGGGGGEYAAESSLAIVDSHQYAITIGQGSPLLAGGNTTIAGQSVTVTAHGGSVATATTAGGAGGTGSSNGTHHDGGAGGAGGGTNAGGGGGGGSGGTAASGNAGGTGQASAGGHGGAAVTNGGAGGGGGAPNANGFAGQSPGGGGGGGGGTAAQAADAADGQITLSSFVTNPAVAGNVALAPLAFSGTVFSGNASGNYAIPELALAATATTAMFSNVQTGAKNSGTGSCALAISASTGSLSSPHLLSALVVTNSQVAFTAPAGWVNVAAQNAGGGAGRIERWYYLDSTGGVTSATFTSSGDCRGYISEWACPPGYTPALDGSTGTASGTSGTSFAVSTPGSAAGGDLLLAGFLDEFSTTTSSQSWTTPSGWALEQSTATGVRDNFAGYSQTATTTGTQSVTGVFSTTTNQTGWAALLTAFTAAPLNTSTSSVTIPPLRLSGTANSVVSGGTVATSGNLVLPSLAIQSPSQALTFPGSPLPIMVEILINGAWTDISSYVYQRDGCSITGRGRPDEASTAQPAQATFTLNNRDGTFSPQNTTGQFYPYLIRNTQLRISVVNAVTTLGAWYTGYRFWGEVPAWPVQWTANGTDVYVPVTACGVLQRMRQSKYSASPVTRYYNNLATKLFHTGGTIGSIGSLQALAVPAGYWPCEDGSLSSSFASGVAGGSPMTWTGTPGLSSDTSVAGSAPFAQLNGSAWTGTPGAFSAGGQTFTTPGTFTWTCPGGITSIKVECWGGGGGGGNGLNGAGGAGGEYAAEAALAVTPGRTYTFAVGAGGAGGAGSFSGNGMGGAAGGNTTFPGDSKTVRAHGGSGAGGHAADPAAPGGTGSTNGTHHNGGNGAATSGHFGGNGGGGSGGNGSAGSNGHQSSGTAGGAGAAAVVDGGPGGAGGTGALASQGSAATPGFMPVPGPGGGGGGGGFSGYNNYSKPGGGGAPGQLTITFGATVVPVPPAVVLRGIIDVPSTGGVDGSCMLQALTAGTVADLHVLYHTGGNLQLVGKDINGTQLFSSGSHAFSANGQPMMVSAELTASPSGTTIFWKLTAITPGATTAVATYTGSVSGALGSVTSVKTNSLSPAETGATGIGHISAQYAVDPILNLAPALAAYAGELAATRFLRLCGEQNVPAVLAGNATDTPQMGAQPVGLLVDLLQDCENADLGQMFELRDTFGLGYLTRVSLQNQPTAVELDYSLAQLVAPLQPTNDDQLTRNDIIATRANGGTSFEAVQSTGALSVQDPPNGVGLYQYAPTPNLFADSQLTAYATWLLILGTLDEYRYPQITVNMIRASVADVTFTDMATLDIGGFLQINNPPPWLPPIPINQLAFGISETFDSVSWVITVNAVPEDPYASTGGSPLPTW